MRYARAVRCLVSHSRTVDTVGRTFRVSDGSASTVPLRSQRHIVVRSVLTNFSNIHTGMGNARGGRPMTSAHIARHSAMD